MLTDQNVEADLSYAYLHAVAARGAFSCSYTHRHLDDAGVDAQIHEDGRQLAPDSIRTSFALHVQLKATRMPPILQNGRFSYNLRIGQYNKLRQTRLESARVLVVLYLPPNPAEWLQHSEEALIARKCAYWVSLQGAPASENSTHQMVYVPRSQLLSVESLTDIMTRCSREEEILYVP